MPTIARTEARDTPGEPSSLPASAKMLTPLRFQPIFKTALWGGTRLRDMLQAEPSPEPTGEAWVLSDVPGSPSVVAEGPWAGQTLRELMHAHGTAILGQDYPAGQPFPLLLKFLYVREPLSVQVHPNDEQARLLEGPGASGKTEAWYILEADPSARLYWGLTPRTTLAMLRKAIETGNVESLLAMRQPQEGECYLVPAGTVHALCQGLLLFEIQQTSDITYRLFDWNRVDPRTGRPRELHVDKGLACVNEQQGPCRPNQPTEEVHGRTRLVPLVECPHFSLGRWDSSTPFTAGAAGQCRVLVGIDGVAELESADQRYPIRPGDVWLLPAEVGTCEIFPQGPTVLLECEPRW